jgi:hypothetical protein
VSASAHQSSHVTPSWLMIVSASSIAGTLGRK